MLFCSNKYLDRIFQKTTAGFVLLMIFSTAAYSQDKLQQKDSFLTRRLSPLFVSAYKHPVRLMIPYVNPPYKPYTVRPGRELMCWPAYPLTAAQIEARNREWDKKNSQSLGKQIANDIIETTVEGIINGRNKKPVAVRPKF